jgi:hypothetical protein
MKALRPVASRLRLRSSIARRRKPLGKRNATAQAVEGNLGGFCALVFVRLADDWRFVGFLFLFFIVLVVLIRISGRQHVAHDHEGTP